jgi:hypothetical protein
MPPAATELHSVVLGLAVAVGLVGVQAAIGAGHRIFDPDPSARTIATRCLVDEKGLAVETSPRDPIAGSASGGRISTVVEGNPLTLVFTDSRDEAAHIAGLYERVAGELGSRLELRGHVVHVWSGDPTSVQRQTVFDCAG